MLAMDRHIGQAVTQAEFDPWRIAPEHEVSMALHMLRSTPSFTISLRGYDKEEVDEYVDIMTSTPCARVMMSTPRPSRRPGRPSPGWRTRTPA
jgi:hypothetical protein